MLLPTAFAQGYDLSVAEARARGTPAILGATGSYLDEAREWDTLVEPHDVEELVRVLSGYSPPAVPTDAAGNSGIRAAAKVHRPEVHARNWLAAVA